MSTRLLEKVGDGYIFEDKGVSRYVLVKDLAKDKIDAIENLLSKKTQETHALVAKKKMSLLVTKNFMIKHQFIGEGS